MNKTIKVLYDGRDKKRNEIIDNILKNRGIDDEIIFLTSSEEDLIPLEQMENIDNAFNIVWNGITNNKRFLIHSDVDVDGATSCAIMYRYLSNYTKNIKTTINKGKKHGISDYDLDNLKDVDIMIIVDSINNDYSDYKRILDANTEIVILDHHIIPDDIKDKDLCIVSSAEQNYPNHHLSGAGVVWKFCKYIDSLTLNDYADSLTDLAMTGIISDMCDITTPENKYICKKGLSNINNKGIQAISKGYKLDGQTISYSIAPLINATMRMNKNEIANQFFMTDSNTEIALILNEMQQAKEEQNQIVEDIINNLSDKDITEYDKFVTIIINSDYSISGLVGNKMLEKYQKPILVLSPNVIADEETGEVKESYYSGSVRAIGVEDFRKICNDTKLVDYAEGHELAFGIKISVDNYDKFIGKLLEIMKDVEFINEKKIDCQLEIHQITKDLIDDIERLSILTGEGFKPILFKINIENYTITILKNKHLKLTCGDIDFLKWNDNNINIYENKKISVIGSLSKNKFKGKIAKQVIIDDIIIKE